jgi:D-alanyl-D-alanine carboxypeptidase/D-alanyl-D-alanine-endopeptidase (penicillin-binding protein 4)
MRQFSLWLFVVVQIFFGQTSTPAQIVTSPEIATIPKQRENTCQKALQQEIEAIINRSQYRRAYWGILIQTLNSPTPLYSLNAEKNFVPASNVKLLITAAALLKLSPDYRFRTSVYRRHDTITVVGRGDPTLTTAQLQTLAQQLKRQGIENINHLILDASYFPHSSPNSSWEWSDLYTNYGVISSSFNLNQNSVTLKLIPQKLGKPLKFIWSDPLAGKQWEIDNQGVTSAENTKSTVNIRGNFAKNTLRIEGQLPINSEPDSWEISIPNPDRYFLVSLTTRLAQQGIKVGTNKIVTDSTYPQNLGENIANIESENLIYIINKTNQDSNNLYAETLLKTLAKDSKSVDGIEIVKQTLKEVGLNPETYHLSDGSGLSRQNLVSPEIIAILLTRMLSTQEGNIYKQSLAQAGINGTLKNRFVNTPVKIFLMGKTGTLTGVSALSGYLESPRFYPLVFSIIVNQSEQRGRDLRQAIDEIILSVDHKLLGWDCRGAGSGERGRNSSQ